LGGTTARCHRIIRYFQIQLARWNLNHPILKEEQLTNLNHNTISVRCFFQVCVAKANTTTLKRNGVITSITAIQLLIFCKAKTIYKQHSNNHHKPMRKNFIDNSVTFYSCTITKTYQRLLGVQ
jgi:hypothetical protein